MPHANDLQALLAEDRWIRRLAAKLVAEPGTADDLVQDTYLTVLTTEARPRDPRAWLSGIVRNLWRDLARSGMRRALREAAHARREPTASTDDLVAEVELRRRVAELVLELEEPLRRTLILRFFKDHTLTALARAERISVSTAHERVERGLARLRARLDTDRGRRRSWGVACAALGRTRSLGVPAAFGALTMGTGSKVVVAALVLASGFVWFLRREGRIEGMASVGDLAPHAMDLGAEPAPAMIPAESAREPSVQPATPSAATGNESAAATARVQGRVLDPDRAPLAGIQISLIDAVSFEALEGSDGTSGPDGGFDLPVPAPVADVVPMSLDPTRATLLRELLDGEWLIVLTDAAAYAGLVVDESGTPIAGATVSLGARRSYFRELGLFRPPDLQQEGWKVRTDLDGRFALPAAPAGEAVELQAAAVGFSPKWISIPPGLEQQVKIVLERPDGAVVVHGIVLGPAGEPVGGARVSTLGSTTEVLSSDDGTFTLHWIPAATSLINRPDGISIRMAETHIHAVKEGLRPALVELAQVDLREPIELRLLEELAVTGRVVDSGGSPLGGVFVWAADPTPLGTVVGGSVRPPANGALNLENVLGGRDGRCVTSADGRFRFGQLLPREYQLMAYAPKTAAISGPLSVEAGESEVLLVLDHSRTRRVAGRLVSADGEPFAGAVFQPSRPELEGFHFGLLIGGELPTDAEGRFEFPGLVVAGTSLAFFHPTFFLFETPLDESSDLEHLEVVVPRLCELQIDLSAQPELARSAKVLDAAGGELTVQRYEGPAGTIEPRIWIRSGKSDVVRVSEAARTLVLLQGDEEVLRLPIQLDPHQRTLLRP